jgi:hypothetical protein
LPDSIRAASHCSPKLSRLMRAQYRVGVAGRDLLRLDSPWQRSPGKPRERRQRCGAGIGSSRAELIRRLTTDSDLRQRTEAFAQRAARAKLAEVISIILREDPADQSTPVPEIRVSEACA